MGNERSDCWVYLVGSPSSSETMVLAPLQVVFSRLHLDLYTTRDTHNLEKLLRLLHKTKPGHLWRALGEQLQQPLGRYRFLSRFHHHPSITGCQRGCGSQA